MKKFLFLLFCSILSFPLLAQNNLVVRDFKYLQYDQTANLKGTSKKDNNGKTAALIKIETTLDNLAFDGGSYGIVTTEHKTGQWWVYVPQRAQKLTIRHPKYGKCEYYYEDEIKAAFRKKQEMTVLRICIMMAISRLVRKAKINTTFKC